LKEDAPKADNFLILNSKWPDEMKKFEGNELGCLFSKNCFAKHLKAFRKFLEFLLERCPVHFFERISTLNLSISQYLP